MWLVPGRGQVVKRRCQIVICGMSLDEGSSMASWAACCLAYPVPKLTRRNQSSLEPGEAAACHLRARRLSWVPWGLLIPWRFRWHLRAAIKLEVSQALSYKSAWHTERRVWFLCSSLRESGHPNHGWLNSDGKGQELESFLFEMGDLNQTVAEGLPWCLGHSGERRGNTSVQSQLEMPNKSLLRLQWWIASWERAVQMLYWIFKEQFFIGAEMRERTACSKSLKTNRATALQVCE